MTKIPIDTLGKQYTEFESEFNKLLISKEQKTLILKIDNVLDALDLGDTNQVKEGFDTWMSNQLILAEEKLARYSETLGEFILYHESRSDFAYIWRKGAYANDWLPVKTKLKNELTDKVTNPEVENQLTAKYLGEQYYAMFHRRRADYLIRKMEAIDRMIRTITHRINELKRQEGLPQDSQ